MSASCKTNSATFTSTQNKRSSQTLWQRLWITNAFCEFTPSCGTRWINRRYILRTTVSPCQFAHCHYTDTMPSVHCDMCTIRNVGSILFFTDHKFTQICYTFSNTILWTTVQLWQDNILCLFFSMTEQQLTSFLTLFLVAIKPAVKHSNHTVLIISSRISTSNEQHLHCMWQVSVNRRKLLLVLLLHEVCEHLILTATFHHLL
jgi:hypothetical protein